MARTDAGAFAPRLAVALPRRLAVLVALVVCLLAGCGQREGAQAGVEEGEEAHDLAFEDVQVTCLEREGVLEGRLATFELTATVRNGTSQELAAESMPTLSSSGLEPTTFDCEMEPDTLASGATGTVSFEGMFDLGHDVVPVLGFSCALSCTGLEGAQADLNAGLATIVASCADAREPDPTSEDARERERTDAVLAMRACVGATAAEGLEAAKAAGYSPIFKDGHGVDVTMRVRDSEDETGVREATIAEVDVSHGLILDSVTFALDYTDPDAALEREQAAAKAEEEARARAEAEAAGALVEETKDDVAVTVDDNDDFARLLAVADPRDPLVARFANAYAGRTVDFNARIVGVTPRDGGRVDLVLVAKPAEDAPRAGPFLGPAFGLRGTPIADLGLTAADAIEVGSTARVRARVVGLDDETSRIFLSPIEVGLA